MRRFTTPEELEVLRVLGLEHKSMRQLVFDILHERHDLPAWMHEARAAKWEPPREWYKDEREQISHTARELIDHHVIGLDANWKCYRADNPNAMQIIAEQAS